MLATVVHNASYPAALDERVIAVTEDPLAELAQLEGVPSATGASRDAVDAILRDRGLRVVPPEESAKALFAAARASAALAFEEDDWHLDNDQSLEGATVRLYTEVVDLAPLVRVAPGQAIARAHTVFGRGILDDAQLGRLRADQVVADRISVINQLLSGTSTAPVITIAGIAHAELISCRPFCFGSGIVARAVEHMILIDGGIDGPAVTVPEAGHQAASDDGTTGSTQHSGYRAALNQYRSGSAEGVRQWLLHVADAVAYGAELSPLNPSHTSRNR